MVAIIRAFWSADIRWGQDSLLKNLESGANKAVRAQLASIYDRPVSYTHLADRKADFALLAAPTPEEQDYFCLLYTSRCV